MSFYFYFYFFLNCCRLFTFIFSFSLFVFLFVYLGIGSFIVSLPLDEMILMIHQQKKMGIDILSWVKIVNVHNILDFFNVKGF
jgi:hypothetical protein